MPPLLLVLSFFPNYSSLARRCTWKRSNDLEQEVAGTHVTTTVLSMSWRIMYSPLKSQLCFSHFHLNMDYQYTPLTWISIWKKYKHLHRTVWFSEPSVQFNMACLCFQRSTFVKVTIWNPKIRIKTMVAWEVPDFHSHIGQDGKHVFVSDSKLVVEVFHATICTPKLATRLRFEIGCCAKNKGPRWWTNNKGRMILQIPT